MTQWEYHLCLCTGPFMLTRLAMVMCTLQPSKWNQWNGVQEPLDMKVSICTQNNMKSSTYCCCSFGLCIFRATSCVAAGLWPKSVWMSCQRMSWGDKIRFSDLTFQSKTFKLHMKIVHGPSDSFWSQYQFLPHHCLCQC